MKSKNSAILFFIIIMLIFTITACGNNDEDCSEEPTSQVESEDIQENESQPEEQTNTSNNDITNVATLNNITYTVISSRILDETEYTVDSDGMKALLVDMLIENNSDEYLRLSTLMSFNLIGNSNEEYGVELSSRIAKGKLDGIVGPNKILRGEFVFLANDNDSDFTLQITPSIMSDLEAKIAFNESSTYDVAPAISSTDGKQIGDEITGKTLSYVINGTSLETVKDRTVLVIDFTAKNNSSEMITEYSIPFGLINANGYTNEMDSKTTNDTLAEIPANGEKSTQIFFKLLEPETTSFDLYLAPMFSDINEVVHLEL
jgi:hypothetical protein